MRVLNFILAGLTAAALSWLLTPVVRRLAIRLDAVDHPSPRKVHGQPIPRLGGLAVLLAAAPVFGVMLTLRAWVVPELRWFGIALGLLPIAAVSLVDDVRGLSAGAKVLGHLAGAVAAVACGVSLHQEIHLFGHAFEIGYLAWPLSVLWLVGVTNAFNLVDGLDGLSAGLALISAGSLVAVFLLVHQTGVALAVSILAGALLGFLPFNVYPARIFLGDTGATAIGFILGCLTLSGGTTLTAGFATLLPVIILGIPVTDTLLSMLRRALHADGTRAEGTGVFDADRSHIHHRLLEKLGHPRAVLVLYGVGLVLALIGLFSITLNVQENGLLLVGLLVAAFVGIGRLGYQEFGVIRSGFVLKFYDTPVLQRSLFVVFVDLVFVAVAIYVAVVLKYDDWSLLRYRRLAISMAATLWPLTVTTMWALGVYQGTWRLASAYEAMRLCLAVLTATALGLLFIRPLTGQEPALSLFFVYTLVKLAVANGSRLSYRMLASTRSRASMTGSRVLIYGAGRGGANAVREMLANPTVGMCPVGFIDDDPARGSKAVNGFPILGSIDRLEECLRTTRASALILSTKKIPQERIELARTACDRAGVRLLRMDIRFDECGRPDRGVLPAPDSSHAAIGPALSQGG